MTQHTHFRHVLCRVAQPARSGGVGKEVCEARELLDLQLIVHPHFAASAVILTCPGYQDSIHGYNHRFDKLARLLKLQGVGATVQMENRARPGYQYSDSIVDDTQLVLDYILRSASDLCGTSTPDIYVVGFSAGAGGAAALLSTYPAIKKAVLIGPSFDAGPKRIAASLGQYTGELYILIGERDEVVKPVSGEAYRELAFSAAVASLVVVPGGDHWFTQPGDDTLILLSVLAALKRPRAEPKLIL